MKTLEDSSDTLSRLQVEQPGQFRKLMDRFEDHASALDWLRAQESFVCDNAGDNLLQSLSSNHPAVRREALALLGRNLADTS